MAKMILGQLWCEELIFDVQNALWALSEHFQSIFFAISTGKTLKKCEFWGWKFSSSLIINCGWGPQMTAILAKYSFTHAESSSGKEYTHSGVSKTFSKGGGTSKCVYNITKFKVKIWLEMYFPKMCMLLGRPSTWRFGMSLLIPIPSSKQFAHV